jgi:hypothetical protein
VISLVLFALFSATSPTIPHPPLNLPVCVPYGQPPMDANPYGWDGVITTVPWCADTLYATTLPLTDPHPNGLGQPSRVELLPTPTGSAAPVTGTTTVPPTVVVRARHVRGWGFRPARGAW